MRIKDKVAVVTGAASGIGLAIATRFVAEGAKVSAVSTHGTDLGLRFKECFGLVG